MSPPRRPVDLNGIKGRVAEALVESIFMRAQYKMGLGGFRVRPEYLTYRGEGG
jgi:hypothetical protein